MQQNAPTFCAINIFSVQVINFSICFFINLYCLICLCIVKKLQSLEFYLVHMQTFIDCFFIGLVGLIWKLVQFGGRVEKGTCFLLPPPPPPPPKKKICPISLVEKNFAIFYNIPPVLFFTMEMQIFILDSLILLSDDGSSHCKFFFQKLE